MCVLVHEPCSAWWNKDWVNRNNVTITAPAGAALAQVPVLVRLHTGNFSFVDAKLDGSDARQHTFHKGFDVLGAAVADGHIVYQLGADLRVYDLATNKDSPLAIRLATDLDQERERWVKKPLDYTTSLHVSTTGDRVVATTRGQVIQFLACKRQCPLRWQRRRGGASLG